MGCSSWPITPKRAILRQTGRWAPSSARAERGNALYSIRWQAQSSILSLNRETAREAMEVVSLQVAANRQKLAITEAATGRPVSIDELQARAAYEAEREKKPTQRKSAAKRTATRKKNARKTAARAESARKRKS